MAIAFDTSATLFSGGIGASTSVSASYTVSGANPVLFVGATVQNSTADWITGVTYNGVNASRITQNGFAYLYVLSGPSTGSHTLSVTFNAAFVNVGVAAASYSGATTFSGAAVDNSTSATAVGTANATATLSPVADNCWTALCAVSAFTTVIAASSGTTARQIVNAGSVSVLLGDSAGPIHPAAAYSMSVNSTGADTIDSIMASFAPFGGGGGGTATRAPQTFSMTGMGM